MGLHLLRYENWFHNKAENLNSALDWHKTKNKHERSTVHEHKTYTICRKQPQITGIVCFKPESNI